MRIEPGDLGDPRVLELLKVHMARARAESPPCSVHALDASGLAEPEISFFAGWEHDDVVAIGALKELAPDRGEVKSMHTALAARGRGFGTAMLRHIVATARSRGMRQLSLETGVAAYFRPAHELYRRHGFRECVPFADYKIDPNSLFMTLPLTPDDKLA